MIERFLGSSIFEAPASDGNGASNIGSAENAGERTEKRIIPGVNGSGPRRNFAGREIPVLPLTNISKPLPETS